VPLYDNPPHRTSTATLTTGTDAGGGLTHNYTTVQTAIPCVIDTASSSEVEMYGQKQIRVTHCIAYKASVLTTALARGMKITADDTGQQYHIHGIRKPRVFGSIPAFVYADVESLE
jgi:hypothetical protein